MDKIKVYADLFGRLQALCETMQVGVEACAPRKLAEHLNEVYRMGDMLSDGADALCDGANEALDALRYQNFIGGIDALSAMVEQMRDLKASVDTAYDELAHTLCALRALLEPAGWSPIRTDDEIRQAIDEGFELTNVMSLGYRDGQYALLFEEAEDDEALVADPFLIALGGEEDYDEIRAFVEQFMDMEDHWEEDE